MPIEKRMFRVVDQTVPEVLEVEDCLARNIVLFGRLLRRAGVAVSPFQTMELLRAMGHFDFSSRRDFKAAARSLLLTDRRHLELFDRVFELFWNQTDFPPQSLPSCPFGQSGVEASGGSALSPAADSDEEDSSEFESQAALYSALERLGSKDFARLTEEEAREVRHFIRSGRWIVPQSRTRRKHAVNQKCRSLDFRRSLRCSLRFGGEILKPAWKARKLKPRPLVILCDVSGSMQSYSRLLVLFMQILVQRSRRVESFVFGTRLTRITPQLRDSDAAASLARVFGTVEDWAGGTRTGCALKSFNRSWARRLKLGRAIVIVVSDGWDCGETELLEQEIKRLKRMAFRVVWLNPLLATPGYEPRTRALQAVLPVVDAFLPIHNLHSLLQLWDLLGQLCECSPRSSSAFRQGGIEGRLAVAG